MRISVSWIQGLLGVPDLGLRAEELAERLTLHLAEIDAVERIGAELDGVVVGRVLSCTPHPDADRLRCTTVDIGSGEPLPIVCGAANVAAGQLVPVATIGTRLTMSTAAGPRELVIKAGTLRGQPSHGMICAEDELGLGTDHDGILVLAGEHAPGTPLARALGREDQVLVVDNHNINHRPDLWGQLGWAREIAAILGLPPPPAPDISWQDKGSALQVTIEDPGCLAYCGALVEGVHNGPSPEWLQRLLLACGQRPLGLLVDLTNYVMLELGEPMHAFDRRQLAEACIRVRGAAQDETLALLDGRVLRLVPEDLVIADETRALALAGIMGGAASGVADDTTSIVLEAATFHAARIRRSRIRCGVASESSSRFEKGLYPELGAAGINRALALLAECCPDMRVTCRFAQRPAAAPPRRLRCEADSVSRRLGLEIPAAEQTRLLTAIGCHCDADQITVPWWRAKDLRLDIDLIEEIGRLHGYDRIQAEPPRLPVVAPQPNQLRRAEHRSRRLLAAQGLDEIATSGFTSSAWAEALAWPAERRLELAHPLSSTQTVLRASLLPNLAEAAARNLRFLDRVACYEIGRVYAAGTGAGSWDHERLVVCGLISGASEGDDAQSPFYPAREAALALLRGLGREVRVQALTEPDPELLAGRSASLQVGSLELGRVGEVPAALRQLAGCPRPLALFRIELEAVLQQLGPAAPVAFRPPSRFQAVTRDFTFVCPEELPFQTLADLAGQTAGPLLRSVTLAAPVFRDAALGQGHKALSLRLELQAEDRTLADRELQKLSERVIRTVERGSPARLRA